MNYQRLSAEIQDFNSKNYKLKKRNGGYAYTSNALFLASWNMIENGGLVFFNDDDPSYFYESGNYKSSFEAMIIDKYGDEIYDGVVLTHMKADGRYRLFTIDGGGEGDTETTARSKYVVDYLTIDDIFEPVQKAFGIELVDKVSDEAKEWCKHLKNQWNMHEGYIDDNNVRHEPYDYPVFDTVADNIYVRLCINNSSLVLDFYKSANGGAYGPSSLDSYVCVYIDPVEGKTYFPYDLIQFFSNTVDSCGGFNTDNTVASNSAINAGNNMSVPMRSLNQNDAPIVGGHHLNNDEVIAAVNNNGLSSIIYQKYNAVATSGRVTTYIFEYITVENDFTVTKGNNANYNYAYIRPTENGIFKRITITAEHNRDLGNSLDVKNVEVSTKSTSIGLPSDNTFRITWNRSTGEFVDYNRTITGTWSGAGTCFVGYKMAANLIGTKPSTPSNIQSSYATWYNNGGVNLRAYRGVDITSDYGSIELNVKILPMSIGEDAASSDKNQSDVWSGETREQDLDTDTPTVKDTMKDEGTTDFDSIPSVFRVGAGCYHLYALTTAQIDDLFKFLYTNQTFEQWLGKFCAGDLSKSVIDIYRIPLNVLNSGTDATAIKVGIASCTDGQGGVVAKEYFNRIFSTHFGSLTIYPEFEDQRDYEPITRCKIFLPFSGFHDISIDDIMGATISLDANVDLISGSGVYSLTVERDDMKAVLYTWTFNCRADFPITGELHRSFVDSLLGLSKITTGLVASSAAGGAVGLVAGGAAVMGAANLAKPITYNGGNLGAIDGFLTMTKPFLLIDRPGYGEPEAFEEIMGRSANTNVVLGAIKGYTQVREVHVDSIDEATAWEKDEIARLLKSGVIL